MSVKPFSNKVDAFASWRLRDFSLFITGRFFVTIGIQMQSVIVGWQVYDITKDVLSLGLIGLAEAIPFIAVSFLAGHVADRYNRKAIIMLAMLAFITGTLLLTLFTWKMEYVLEMWGVMPIYAVTVLTGFARGFYFPTHTALIAQIVPRSLYPNSSTWNSLVWHIAAVSGPAAGGLIYGFAGITPAYVTVVGSVLVGMLLFSAVKPRPVPMQEKAETFVQSLSAGIRFVFRQQVLVGSLSLDMFAVLFGGATALLPVFAAEVLHVGPEGLGFLRAAPMLGAVLMSLYLAYHPPVNHTGKKLFISVAGFGLCMIAFALSRNFYLSLFLLALSGVFDNVSVVIRSTIIQLFTPDHMRGRVAAVNSIFVGSSNEIGAFESGVAARIMGLVPSVIFGGGMTLLVTGAIARYTPKLRKMQLKEVISN
jgi:MFS family permease